MKAALWMAVGSVGSALLVVAVTGLRTGADVALGMVAPLAAASVSWVLTERIYTRDPKRLTGAMMTGFAAKMVFFGAWVAIMLRVVGVRPVPFVAGFTGYFIALYLVEALLMRRLFTEK